MANRNLQSSMMANLVVVICLLSVVSMLQAFEIDEATTIEKASTILESSRGQQEEDLRAFVGFGSVAAIESYKEETRKCAGWLRDFLKSRLGMQDANLYESGYRNPVVVGSSTVNASDKDKPAVVIYGHYDVQPVDGEWTISDPFELKKIVLDGYGEVFTGRGSQDCKGTLYASLSAIAALHDSLDGGLASLPVRIIVCVEGEEEIGSPGFGVFLKENIGLFDGAEIVFSADGGQPALDGGGLRLSNRGLFGVQIDAYGANTDLHSGTFGGSILNPIVALSRVVSSLHDPETNRIAVEGFYDSVEELTEEERAELVVVDDVAEAARLGVSQMIGEIGYSTMERKTVRPTLELSGIWGGFQDEGIKTVLPSEAHAKITMRLVSDQNPDDIYQKLEEHIAKIAPVVARGLKVSLQRLNPGAKAYKAPRHSEVFKLVKSELTSLFGKEPVLMRAGGSVNAFADFHEIASLESISFGFGATDSMQHAVDERFRLYSLQLGQKAYMSLILKAAKLFGKTQPNGEL